MPDNKNNRGPQDRSRISLEQAHEIRYWTDALGVTEDDLINAVKRVGHSAQAVRNLFNK